MAGVVDKYSTKTLGGNIMILFTTTEQEEINQIFVNELDRLTGLGVFDPVCINDGRIVGCEEVRDYDGQA